MLCWVVVRVEEVGIVSRFEGLWHEGSYLIEPRGDWWRWEGWRRIPPLQLWLPYPQQNELLLMRNDLGHDKGNCGKWTHNYPASGQVIPPTFGDCLAYYAIKYRALGPISNKAANQKYCTILASPVLNCIKGRWNVQYGNIWDLTRLAVDLTLK